MKRKHILPSAGQGCRCSDNGEVMASLGGPPLPQILDLNPGHPEAELRIRANNCGFGERHWVVRPRAIHHGRRCQDNVLDSHCFGSFKHSSGEHLVCVRLISIGGLTDRCGCQVHDHISRIDEIGHVIGDQIEAGYSIGGSSIYSDEFRDRRVGCQPICDMGTSRSRGPGDDDAHRPARTIGSFLVILG